MAKIATIIPTYNAAGTIGETLDSVIAQTHASDEIIVVDDGSTDSTSEVIKKYSQIKYIKKNNAGVSEARNHGVNASSCDWIAFCDSDDIWHPQKLYILQKCINQLKGHNFFFHNFSLFGSELANSKKYSAYSKNSIFSIFQENKTSIKQILPKHTSIEFSKEDFHWPGVNIYYGGAFKWLVLGNFILPSSVLINKKYFLKHSGFDPKFRTAEETEFFLRISKSLHFTFLDLPLASYRWCQGGLTGNLIELQNSGMKALIKNTVEDVKVYNEYKKQINLGISRRFSRFAYFWITMYELEKARKKAIESIRFKPIQITAWSLLVISMFPKIIIQMMAKIKLIFSDKKL